MKRLLLLATLIFTGCTALNTPTCKLPTGVTPLAKTHSVPYQPAPWTSFDGTRFPYTVWQHNSANPAKAVVILAPGWDGSMTDYSILAEFLGRHGYDVYGSEQRTGVYDPSHDRQGNPSDWHAWVNDFHEFTHFVARKNPGKPIFYHGHSFGTLVAIQTAAKDQSTIQPRGIILQSVAMPFLIEKPNPLRGALFNLAAWYRFPQRRLMSQPGFGPTGSQLLNCQWVHSEDRLPQGYKVRYLIQSANLGHQARLSSRKLPMPVLALLGERDDVVAPKDKDKEAYHTYLLQELKGGRATVISYKDGFHTMTIAPTGCPALDQTTRKALCDIVAWLDSHTSVQH